MTTASLIQPGPVLDARFPRRMAWAAVLSVLLHVLVGVAMLLSPRGGGGAVSSTPIEMAVDPAPDEEVRPGINSSRQVTINWLGFDDPTPHSATPSEIDQAALSPVAPGVPEPVESIEPIEVALAEPVEQPDPAEPVEAATPTEPVDAPTDAPPEPETAETLAAEPSATAPDQTDEAAAPIIAVELPDVSARRIFRQLSRVATNARNAVDALQAEMTREVLAEHRPPQQAGESAPQPTTPPPGEPRDAIPSDKQADAASREQIIDVAPGRPAAAEGLDITTVRPQWTVTTRLSRLPRNPLVRIEFRKNGTVARAAFVESRGTGFADVDGPLLNAIYAWTARGEALRALPADSPQHTVGLTMRILLVPERGAVRGGGDDR